MASPSYCSECRAEIPASRSNGLCTRCLLALGLKAADVDPTSEVGSPTSPPSRFGDYELLEEIARGGMGVVYKARQVSLDRIVAVKLLLGGALASADAVKRFRVEASAAASLQHPHIVAIHEVGVHQGAHYLVMDYVEGRNLARVISDFGFRMSDFPRIARWVKTVAEAVHCAHEHGILHRDLKPSNVLIDTHDEPRVTDFGLAKRFGGEAEVTLSGQLVGSPSYMPPEQAAARRGKVSRRSDVYGLGALLYHLLTGRAPFQAATVTATLDQVLNTDPAGPRLLNPAVPRDLETICLKCLEKEPGQRYPTAQALAEELGRYLNGQPVLARPLGPAGKACRWGRRQPVRAALIVALAVVFAAGLSGVLWQSQQANRQRREAVEARLRSEQERYAADVALAQVLIEQQQFQRAREILGREGIEDCRGWEWGWLQRQCHRDLMTLHGHQGSVSHVAFSPDQRWLVSSGHDGIPLVWDLETGQPRCRLRGHAAWVVSAMFSPDGGRILTAGLDGTARVWDAQTGEQVLEIRHATGVRQAVFSPDGELIATAARSQGLGLWEARTGTPRPLPSQHAQPVQSLAFSPDGRRLACAGGGAWATAGDEDTSVSIFELASGKHWSFLAHRHAILGLAFSPDGVLLASASTDGTVRLWEVETGSEVRARSQSLPPSVESPIDPQALPVPGLSSQALGGMFGVQFSPCGRWLAVGGSDFIRPLAQVVEVSTGRPARRLGGHSSTVGGITFSPDGTRLATASYDETVKVWPTAGPREFLSLEGHDQPVWTIAFSPDGRRLASGSLDQTLRLWDTDTGSLLVTLPVGLPVLSLAFSPDGQRVATPAPHRTAKLWDAATGNEILSLTGHAGTVLAVAWSSDGQWLLTGSKDGTATLWDARRGTELRTFQGHAHWVLAVAFSPDGQRLATGSADGTVRLWDARTGQSLLPPRQGHQHWVQTVAFSPDGAYLATGGRDRRVILWDAHTGARLSLLAQHQDGISSLAFSPDGRRLATAAGDADVHADWARDRSVAIWDVFRGQLLLSLNAHWNAVMAVAFSPEGRRLATASVDHTIRIWEAFPWRAADYPADPAASLAQRVEAFKRRHWQERLRSPAWTTPLDAPPTRPGRRLECSREGTMNLPAERGTKNRPALPLPPRDPLAPGRLIDLGLYYNVALTETWPPCSGLVDIDLNLSELPSGLGTFAGVPFDVRGCLRLSRNSAESTIFPSEVSIAVNRRFHRFHVLHGTGVATAANTQIGSYGLCYADGTAMDLPIRYGRDVRDWWVAGDPVARATEAEVAWTGWTEVEPRGRITLRLFKRTYLNPAPDREVAAIRFASAGTSSGPFLVALTLEP